MLLSPWASSPYSNPFTGSFFPSFFFSSSFGVVLCSSNHTHTHTYYSICIYTWASYQFRSLRASRDFVRCSFMCMNWLCDSCFSRIALTFLCSLFFTLYVSRVQSIICPSKIRKKLFNTTLFLLWREEGCLFPLRRRTFQCMNYLGICLWHQHHLSFGFVTVLSCKMLIIYPNRSCKQLLYPQHVLNSNQSPKFQASFYKFISFTFFHFNFEIACVSFLCDLIGNVKDSPIYNTNWTSKRDRWMEKEINIETERGREGGRRIRRWK